MDRFNWVYEQTVKNITNKDLVCKDCAYRRENVSHCLKYKQKPNKVLLKEECKKYKKEE